MRCTLSGENSREAIILAAKAGFDCIETDVRYTSDSVLVAVHDANLTRAYTYSDGSEVPKDIRVCDLTWAELRDGFILKASRPESRTRILTVEEFLTECRDRGLYTFIEPKEPMPDWVGERMIGTADSVFGRGNYVITSNNRVNEHIRFDMGIDDIRLMGVLYQTTYERISALGDAIVAVSTSKFGDAEYAEYVGRAAIDGFETESHADSFSAFNKALVSGVDYISTDLVAPDYHGQGCQTYFRDGVDAAAVEDDLSSMEPLYFGGIYMEISWTGTAEMQLGSQLFELPQSDEPASARHQLMLFDERPRFSVMNMSEDFTVRSLSVRVVEF